MDNWAFRISIGAIVLAIIFFFMKDWFWFAVCIAIAPVSFYFFIKWYWELDRLAKKKR